MTKILIFIESLYCGGAEKSLMSLLDNMDYNNYDVTLMVLKSGGEFEKFVPENIKKEELNFNLNSFDRAKFKLLRFLNINKLNHNAQLFWQSVNSKVPENKSKYDVAIAWGQGFATYYVSQKVNATKKIAWVNIDYKKAGYNWKKDLKIYKKFEKVIGVSEFVTESMQKFLPKEQVLFIRDIIDPAEIKSKGLLPKKVNFDNSKINIVSVGRLAKQKGFELAIGSIKILKEKKYNVHLYIIGEGQERNFLENEIKLANLENDCTLVGFDENPFSYINDCDIYLQSSWFEGLGRTIIEAGLLCKPIVTTNFPTAFSILENNKTGLITEMDSISISKSIEKLLSDTNLKDELIENLKNQEDKEKEKTLSLIYNLLG